MNTPVRRLALACLVLFLLLLVNANIVQVVEANSLSHNPHNGRLLIQSYQRQRGDIVVGGQAIAESVPTKGGLKYLRTYPGGAEYAAVTGFYSLIYGSSDIERAYDAVLSGTDPRLTFDRFSALFTGRQPQGGSVTLTIDRATQDAAWAALAGKQGAIVALDPRTGAILALVTSPSYDPSVISTHNGPADIAAYHALLANPLMPMVDRATQEIYPPGSTFKIVTTAAALASGKYTPQTVVPAPAALALPQTSHVLHNFARESCSPTGTQTLTDAFRVSCDTAYAKIGLTLGGAALRQQAASFGIGQTIPGFPLAEAASSFPAPISPPFVAFDAIGQGDVAMSPLQMAMITSAVANGGVEMKPYLVAKTQAPNLSTLDTATPQEYTHPMSAQVAAEITTLMTLVVQSGTGTAAQIPGVAVAGKTGTAQQG
ncbi:MAG: peptidoglycan D,D-transpeptidase FtsI family protein, partial [Mycobacteriales bacterium]